MSEIKPTPQTPNTIFQSSTAGSVKIADPDLLVFNDSQIPVSLMTDMLFEQIGGQELLSISRHDLLNGQRKSYSLISNIDKINRVFSSKNFIKMSGTLPEKFKGYSIQLGTHVPANGTGPAAYYVGPLGSNGCSDYPVLDRYDDTQIACYPTYQEAQEAIDTVLAPQRPTVYSEPDTGNLVVDVTRMRNNEQVDIEVLSEGIARSDTIY